ncbi:MAG TPA: anti-sigma factor [Symbiobacteriaceae bacterium]|nr:anti-sigma factor [Symbiobacteriaceae bacterium]
MAACPRVDEAILYSLRQMPSGEEQAFAAHLDTCLACRLKLQEIQETLDILPLTVGTVEPPPGLRDQVLARVAAEAAAGAQQKRRRLPPVWAAAAVLALGLGIYSLVGLQGLQERLAGFQQAVPHVERSVGMLGTENAPGAVARVLVAYESTGTRISLQAQGMPPLESGQAYQLWLIKDGQRRSGGVFVVDASGTGGVATWLPDRAEFDALGITREPDALGQQPRGIKMLSSI